MGNAGAPPASKEDSAMSATEDRIDPGADVIGSEGEMVGSVAYVVVQPPKMHVTDVVVSTGFLGRDIVVPTDRIDHIADGKVYLSMDKDTLGTLEDYVEVHYESPPDTWGPGPGYFYPGGSVLWPAGSASYYPEPASVTVHAPPGTVGLSEGMTVETTDGHKVGTVKSVETDHTSGDVSGLIIKEGLLFSHDEEIPGDLIQTVHEGRVTLKLTKDELEERHGLQQS
jgi:sporulation protein YlmC with PRC-barrel domain